MCHCNVSRLVYDIIALVEVMANYFLNVFSRSDYFVAKLEISVKTAYEVEFKAVGLMVKFLVF